MDNGQKKNTLIIVTYKKFYMTSLSHVTNRWGRKSSEQKQWQMNKQITETIL